MAKLIVLEYSPWSEKARWALDHHHVPYRLEHYVPMLGEPLLRLRTGRFSGRVSVPVLLDEDEATFDSLAIARHAERKGSGAPLFPDAHRAEIARWNDLSNDALRAGRTVLMNRLLADRDAQEEALPGFVPRALRAALAGLGYIGARFVVAKYGIDTNVEAAEAKLVSILDELRAGLDGRAYLLDGQLTFADLAMAVVPQIVRPVSDAFLRLGPATRRAWTTPALESRYADLLEWRDQTYAKHRHD